MTPVHYDAQLRLDPYLENLEAVVKVSIPITQKTSQLEFILHRGFKLESLECTYMKSYEFDRDHCRDRVTSQGGTFRVDLTQTVTSGDVVELQLEYSGEALGVTSDFGVNQLTPEWTELGLYTPWYPYTDFQTLITYSITVSIDPQYAVTGLGKVKELEPGVWRVSSRRPQRDMVIVAAPELYTLRSQDSEPVVAVQYTEPGLLAQAQFYVDEGSWLLDFYKHWLGSPGVLGGMSIVISPRVEGGGYSRTEMLVMSTPEDPLSDHEGSFRWLAHEAAHFWWTNAPADSWQDWLNEGFAEYSSLVAVRHRLGEQVYQKRLEVMRSRVTGSPPVMGLDRSADEAHTVLYEKTCVLLDDLARSIGEEAFTKLVRATAAERVATTAEFLGLLSRVASMKDADRFEQSLRN